MATSRRTILWLLAAGLPSLAVASLIRRGVDRRSPGDQLRAFCAAEGCDARTRAVGEDFLRRFPEEASIDRLIAELVTALPSPCGRRDLIDRLGARIREEFASDEGLVTLARFFTTRTEGRVCALCTLLTRKS